MSDPEQSQDNVIRLELRRVERHIPGIGASVLREPDVEAEAELAGFYASAEPDQRAFVTRLIVACVESPEIDAVRAEALSERARAIARVGIAEVCGISADYKRLGGSGRSGDDRLFQAMKERQARHAEQLKRISRAMTTNVFRLGEQTQQAFRIMDQTRNALRLTEQTRKAFALPDHLFKHQQLGRTFQLRHLQGLTPRIQPLEIFKGFARQQAAMTPVWTKYMRTSELLSEHLRHVVRPSYFGALGRISRQFSMAAQPTHLDSFRRLVEQVQVSARPWRSAEELTPLGRWIQHTTRSPLFESLRDAAGARFEAYSAWLERNWAQVHADPDHPPVMFVLASLPMAIGLPLLRSVEIDDEPLLRKLEKALDIDALQSSVQACPELDQVSKHHLARGLEWVRTGQYVDAAPPLYQGLERAFRQVARRREIIDTSNRFIVDARKGKMHAVDDLFEHLEFDPSYLRYLRSWIFGETGNLVRHGDLPEDEYRRWTLRAVVALLGWFEPEDAARVMSSPSPTRCRTVAPKAAS